MSVSIEPLSSLPDHLVIAFLTRYGHDPAIAAWKYHDREFNGSEERGLAGVENGHIVAFLGLIPFTVLQGGQPCRAAWSCDWYKDPEVSGPIAILLFKQSLRLYSRIYSLGGSEATRAIMPRLSRITIVDAGMELHKPLRAGGLLKALAKATGVKAFSSFTLLNTLKLPLRLPFRQVGKGAGEASLSESLSQFSPDRLTPVQADGDTPSYDLAYLRWLLERCPAISGSLCLVSGEGEVAGALPFWHPAGDMRFWRLCLLPGSSGFAALEKGLLKALHNMQDRGGWLVSILISHRDTDALTLLKRYGFQASQSRRPLFVMTREAKDVPAEPTHLTYLDTDYAYRFPDLS